MSEHVSSPAVDGITPPPNVPAKKTGSTKSNVTLLFVIIGVYVVYGIWSITLITLVPNEQHTLTSLIAPGVFIASIMGVLFLVVAGLGGMRLMNATDAPRNIRILGFARLALLTIPGLVLSGTVPMMITREPPLRIAIIEPTTREAFVAPMAVTFSLEHAVNVLKQRGLTPLKYRWDFDGDGEENQETVEPTVTAIYERKGVYNVVARIEMSNRSSRRVTQRLVISRAVFSVQPMEPIVDEPTRFSVSHLVVSTDEVK